MRNLSAMRGRVRLIVENRFDDLVLLEEVVGRTLVYFDREDLRVDLDSYAARASSLSPG